MSWDTVIGQKRVKELFRSSIMEGRLAQAYILWGAEGVGKDALALALAKTVNCDRRPPESAEPCNSCRSCLQADRLEHPNIRLVFSLPAGKSSDSRDDSPLFKLTDAQIEEIQDQLRLKSENPYHNIAISNARQIRIASIRDVKKTLSMSPSQSGRRVVIISEADEMTTEAANAFLKTLEEPNGGVTLILTTSRKDMLPKTILSRCQQMYCEPIADKFLADYLSSRHNVSGESARLAAAFAQGSYSRALEFLDKDMGQLRQDIVDLLRAALKKRRFCLETLHLLEKIMENNDRAQLQRMVHLLETWLRDVYAFSISGAGDFLVNVDQREVIERFATAFPGSDYPRAILAAEAAALHLSRNVHPPLALIPLLLECRSVFLGR